MPAAIPHQSVAQAAHTETQIQHPGAGLPPTLTLRGESRPTRQRRAIRWAADVVDNEGMGKKSSKVCCIYHKPRAVGESSDESSSSSSSDSDSDSEPDTSKAHMGGKGKARRDVARKHRHGNHDEHHGDGCPDDHEHDHGKDSDADDSGPSEGPSAPRRRRTSPNAYERVPAPRHKKAAE